MKFKAVITDLDGTAVKSPEQKMASNRLVSATAELQRAGLRVCAATGRGEKYAWDILEGLNAQGPHIVSGGTRIIDSSRKELWKCALSSDQVVSIKDALKQYSHNAVWNDYDEADYLDGGWKVEKLNESIESYLIEAIFVPIEEAGALIELLHSSVPDIAIARVVALRPNTYDLHITHVNATKEHAVYELERILGIDRSKMIGVGDGPNDSHLFAAVGHRVAMGNAVDELKEQANEVIGNVENDGLAEYFEKLVEEARQ